MSDGDKRIAEFIQNTLWEKLPEKVREQAVKCAVDLFGAVAAGKTTRVAQINSRLVSQYWDGRDATNLMTGEKVSLPGAAFANGFAANALDIDDGHRMIKGHPGAVVFPAVLAAGEKMDISLKEFLTALVVAYEIAIRSGLAIQKHYSYFHSTGTWGAVGAAAGASRILGLDAGQIENAIGIAEFHAPLVPVMRSVETPSMNKDGVGWGAMSGIMASLMAKEGFTGRPSLFDSPEYCYLVDSLGVEFEMLNLYFKPYTCCRWAHPSVKAVIDLMNKYLLIPKNIKKVDILTFKAAASLYRKKPTDTEEAQYNAVYPVAAAIMAGNVGLRQVLEEFIGNPDVLSLMDIIDIKADERFEKEFPGKRLCEVQITTNDGRVLKSGIYEPIGEPDEPVSLEWIINKFQGLVSDVLEDNKADSIVNKLTNSIEDTGIKAIIRLIT